MKKTVTFFITLTTFLAFMLAACSGGAEDSTESTSAEKKSPVVQSKKEDLSPAELGQKIGGIYAKAMSELVGLLKDKPEVSDVRSKIDAVKEAYIRELIALGKERESLDAPGRAAVDSQINLKMNALYNNPDFNTFNDLQQHYFQDRDFHKLILSFNIITQYANFDLLKKQEPEEAARLGIQ